MGMTIADLSRTLSTVFRIATVRLKDVSGALHIRNSADNAFIDVAAKRFKFMGNNASNGLIITAPDAMGGNVTLTLPGADGATGQVLSTDGSGTLQWSTPGAASGQVEVEAFTEATSSPHTVFTAAQNEVMYWVEVEVVSPAAGGAPTMSIGIVGDTGAIMASTEIDLKEAGRIIKFPFYVMASQAAVIASITADGQSFSGFIRISHGTPA